jgi:hypothetical protein
MIAIISMMHFLFLFLTS